MVFQTGVHVLSALWAGDWHPPYLPLGAVQLFADAVDVVVRLSFFISSARRRGFIGFIIGSPMMGQRGSSLVCSGAHDVLFRVPFLLSESAAGTCGVKMG